MRRRYVDYGLEYGFCYGDKSFAKRDLYNIEFQLFKRTTIHIVENFRKNFCTIQKNSFTLPPCYPV